ncbi:uncharacterized protein LOC141898389 [Tubulanus polymorphus]|uniref:uncharacterized protein LOC141898389 n=1 Tax=Tubulanus polymorphus TaxID=672921 RepID=UPI003DA55871
MEKTTTTSDAQHEEEVDDDTVVVKKRKRNRKPSDKARKRPPVNGQKRYYCAYCQYFSSELLQVNKHRISVHGTSILLDQKKTTTTTNATRPIMKSLVNNTPGPRLGKLKCVKCDKIHLSALYPCHDCNYLASCLNEALKHVKSAHKKSALFLCPFCACPFIEISKLELHLLKRHVTNEENPLAFLNRKDAQTNLNYSTQQTKPHKSMSLSNTESGKRTPWIRVLRKYTCSKGGCKYADYSLLDSVQHEKEHIYENFWLPYCLHVCTKCGFEARLQAVVTHVIVDHGDDVNEKDIAAHVSLLMFELGRMWFLCRSCDVVFDSIYAIGEHLDLKHIVPGFDPTANTPQMKAMLAELWAKHVQEIRNRQWDGSVDFNNETKLFARVSVPMFDVVKSNFIARCISCYEYESTYDDCES